MPQFAPGVTRTAKVKFSNPKGMTLSYIATLYMGTNMVKMAEASFSIDAGQEKEVTFPVTMPRAVGTYPVYIGVSSGGQGIALYQATEDVTIVGVAKFEYVSAIRQSVFDSEPGYPWNKKVLKAEIDVKNTGLVVGVCNVRGQIACAQGGWVWQDFTWGLRVSEATIQPGQIITFYDTNLDSPYYGYT